MDFFFLRKSESGIAAALIAVLSAVSLVLISPFFVSVLLLFILALIVVFSGFTRFVFLAFCFLLPFSVDADLFGGSNLSMPGELVAVLLFFVLLIFGFRQNDSYRIFSRPLFLGVICYFLPILIASVYSVNTIVSVKYVVIQLLYISSCFVLPFILLRSGIVHFREILYALSAGVFLLAVYSLIRLAGYGFNLQTAPALARPFFKDHTIFSALLALLFPVGCFLFADKKMWRRRYFLLWLFVMLSAIMASTSRAAWISIIVVIPLVFLAYRGLKIIHLPIIGFCLMAFFLYKRQDIESYVLSNRNDSNRYGSSISEQALSVTNVTNDVSNLERINRWKCAWRMAKDRPETGFGPGTYQFEYLPYQLKSETTTISLHSPFFPKEGRGGSAHSEYFLSLAECGWTGIFGWLLFIVSFVFTFFRVKSRNNDLNARVLSIFCGAGIVTYLVHAMFNNFMNNINFAGSFWIILALIMYLDLPEFGTASDKKY